LISKNKDRLHKTCFSEGDEGEKIGVIQVATDHEEGLRVASDIADRHYAAHSQYADFAILYRTNAQSRIFEDSLRRKSIPYRIYAGMSFYQRKEIKDLLAYLRLIVNHKDDEAFKRTVNYPKRGIGDTTVERIEAAAAAKGISMWEAVLGLTPEQADVKGAAYKKLSAFLLLIDSMTHAADDANAYDFAHEVAVKSGILEDLRAEKTMENISREENIAELLNGVKTFCETYKEEHGDDPHITQYLENVSLFTDADSDNKDNTDSVTLMTVHSAKGLEFGYVYIVGLEEGLFPNQAAHDNLQNLEEERRLFYVALTRAKTKATVSFAQSRMRWGSVKNFAPSRFVGELDPRYIEAYSSVRSVVASAAARNPATAQGHYDDDSDFSYVFSKKKPAAPQMPQQTSQRRLQPVRGVVADVSGAGGAVGDIRVGSRVQHERFGVGDVIDLADGRATIKFALAGTKTLLLKFAKLGVVG
jgi:DNA helicase-2/ATP-dependent DNA helicase PcrA